MHKLIYARQIETNLTVLQMNLQDIELEIQDTTEHEIATTADVATAETLTCSCGNSFSSGDNGVSAILSKCRSCYAALCADLQGSPAPAAETMDYDLYSSSDENSPFDDAKEPSSDEPQAPPEFETSCLTGDQILNSMMMAVNDQSKSFVLNVNGRPETFVDASDLISGNSRKLFTRKSWQFKELYWYHVFGAISSTKGALITPCVILLKDGGRVVLNAILETMCNRPRYDGLIYDLEKEEIVLMRQLLNKFVSIDAAATFDQDAVDKYKRKAIYFHYVLTDILVGQQRHF